MDKTVQELYAEKDQMVQRQTQLKKSIHQMKKRGKRKLSAVQELNILEMESELTFLNVDIKDIDLKISRAERNQFRQKRKY